MSPKTLTEKLKDPCRCGHSRALHAHGAAFCLGIDEGYVLCHCERFEQKTEGDRSEQAKVSAGS